MNTLKLTNIIKDGNIVIPIYMFNLYKKYNLNLEELVFLMYLCNKNFSSYDPVMISGELNMDINEVMGYISCLVDKGMVNLDVDKTSGIIEEKINLNPFYEKLSLSLIENSEEIKKDDSIFEEIEREFNRKLSPMEREAVIEWQNNEYSNEIIHEAVKEASMNGVNNLRYIDKILEEWHKKGYTTKADIQKGKENNDKKDEKAPYMEIYSYDWFDDEI